MKLVMLGAPGSGKGTQGYQLANYLGIPNISTGDILRQAVSNQTKLGIEAKKYMEAGDLVPDDVMIGIVRERIQESDCEAGFILDGFPRTVPQARALDQMLAEDSDDLDYVLNLNVSGDLLVQRLTSRRVCRRCGKLYNVITNPPPASMVCKECGGEIWQRSDDTEETVINRLEVYDEKTKPLRSYYKRQGKLKVFDGNGTIDEIQHSIREFLDHP
ncbi:adenylate kinase [candidate division KSB1 bacterium]|nr:adenylate kinase [candidate division KSB1 bacterium]